MRYGSVCSGIEAATVAWEPLGWSAQFFSEIEPFPSAVLADRWPQVPNLGDMTSHKEWSDAGISLDVLVGGTPCQSFSVAGLRKGMADPRGNLALTYLAIADQFRPRWLVWENVPGVLSSNRGRDFGAFLGGMGQLGYGFAYRVLDAQYFGVAQRRRRVFVVGCLGDWRSAAAVLFERDSLSGNPAPRRSKGQEAAGTLASRTGAGGFPGTDEACSGYVQPVADTLTSHWHNSNGATAGNNGGMINPVLAFQPGSLRRGAGAGPSEEVFPTVKADHGRGLSDQFPHVMAHVQVSPTIRAGGNRTGGDRPMGTDADTADSLLTSGMAVRRLTPTECERLQGFPDGHTAVTYRGKPASDGPRYKAIGNSMAVPVMRWIGERIHAVSAVSGMEVTA